MNLQKFAWILLCGAALSAPMAHAGNAAQKPDAVTLKKIMSDPDWIGNSPEGAYWSDNGKAIFYEQQRSGSELHDWKRIDLASGHTRRVKPENMGKISAPDGNYNHDHTRKVYARNGDIFVKNLRTGKIRQLTRTADNEEAPDFMADGNAVFWRVENTFFVHNLTSGLTWQPADIRLENSPDTTDEPYTYLRDEQLRVFQALQKDKHDRESDRAREKALASADRTRSALPWYLGDKIKLEDASFSPNGHWLVLVTSPKSYDEGSAGNMPNYVTESGEIEMLSVHRRVGLNPPAPEHVLLLDLKTHKSYQLALTDLPGIQHDPLAGLRKQALTWDMKHGVKRKAAEKSVKAPKVRPINVMGMAWSDDGRHLGLQFHSVDNKDRWLATVDFKNKALITQERLTDKAWINWTHNDFGWLKNNRTLWYLSEKSGYSQLYLKQINQDRPRRLTHGHFVVANPVAGQDSRYIYFSANKGAPGTWEIYRVATQNGQMQQLTHLGGINGPQPALHGAESFALAPDDSKLLLYHSTSLRPPEVYVVATRPGAPAHRVTHTIKTTFSAIDWVKPQIVKVPSTHVDRPIYARLYTPKNYDASKTYPGVIFIHGAGYLQDAHTGWSYYFHELMFNTFLTRHGYVVMDMDYRGSAGYGRDWRTAIYRHMGHPEVDDLKDGVGWLVKHRHVDAKHVGVYGGSYGGFLTYMSMFRAPRLFAAGAALRPVGDWANYNRGYTSAILNTPAVDPKAYETSSPIHFVKGLEHPLLICQGMEDDNVFFQDTVHITQRLIELKKPYFETAFYPLEHHGFEDPASWLDEYRRIFRWFEAHVK